MIWPRLAHKLLLLVLCCFLLAGLAAQGPSGHTVRSGDLWIDPDKSEPAGTSYKLFPTPSRGPSTEASYLIYLPPDYATAKLRRYPVLYWLHGGAGSQREGAWMVERIDREIRAAKLQPLIVVLVQGLPDVRYINTKDGTRPVEDVIILDLIPHIDATYRTIPQRTSRGIEGMSMGGYGALRLGFKYPELFGAVSGLAPSITEMKDEPAIVTEPFGNDQAFYDAVGPWTMAREHASNIRGKSSVRLLGGDQDKLLPYFRNYSELLSSLQIEHQFAIAPGAHHMYNEIIEQLPFDALVFWNTALAQSQEQRSGE